MCVCERVRHCVVRDQVFAETGFRDEHTLHREWHTLELARAPKEKRLPTRNRHCPKCRRMKYIRKDKAQRWLEAQQALLLPVRYFLLTFTLPEGLRSIARSHQRLVYDLLFRVSAEAIRQLGQAERWVGGQMGMMGVLHTLRQAQGRRGAATWPITRTCITWSPAVV